MDVVREDGLDALTMARIAADLDVAVGGLYRYFADKQALLASLQVRVVHDFEALLDDRLRRCSEAPLARVWCAFASWRVFAATYPERYRLVDSSLSDPQPVLDPALAAAVQEALAPVLRRLSGLLDAAAEAGQLTPGNTLLRTHALWAAVHGVEHFRKRDALLPEALHSHHLHDALIKGLLAGWGAPADALFSARPAHQSAA